MRESLVNGIPENVKLGITAGIGLFIAFIGLQGAGVVVNSEATLVDLGSFASAQMALCLIGFIIIAALSYFRVKGAVLIGIIITWILGMLAEKIGWYVPDPAAEVYSVFPAQIVSFDLSGLSKTAFHFNFGWAVKNLVQFFAIVVSFMYVDLFDTVGTVVGVASKANLLDEEGKLPRAGKVLLSDAIGTVAGACLGTSTVTSFVESTAGVAEGGKTGLTAFTTGCWFLIALVFSPVFLAIPSFATAPALLYVGMLMVESITKMKFEGDIADVVGGYMAIVMMPLAYSIATGIMFAMLSWVILKVVTGKIKDVTPVMWGVFILFALRIVTLVTNFS